MRWRFPTGGLIEVSPSVAPDGTVVVASNDPYTYGVGPDGAERWRHRRGALSFSSPSTTDTGLVLAGDHRGGVAILDAATGRQRGRLQDRRSRPSGRSVGVWTSPVVDGSHRSYAGTRDGHVLGFAPDGTGLFDLPVGATVDSYPALTADGALIVGVTDGRLLAVADDAPCTTARRAATSAAADPVYASRRPDALLAVAVVGEVAIGIDDGPDPMWTPAMLAVLARHGAHATFFVVGDTVSAHPELIDRITVAGHELGLHTTDHRDLVGRAAPDVATDLAAARGSRRDSGCRERLRFERRRSAASRRGARPAPRRRRRRRRDWP
ncbi:MAG: polysaccharide deacetylase family protein [Acidimicrobiales bacterium]